MSDVVESVAEIKIEEPEGVGVDINPERLITIKGKLKSGEEFKILLEGKVRVRYLVKKGKKIKVVYSE